MKEEVKNMDLKAEITRAKIIELKKDYLQDKAEWEDCYCGCCDKKIKDECFVYFIEINRITFGFCNACCEKLTGKNMQSMFYKIKKI